MFFRKKNKLVLTEKLIYNVQKIYEEYVPEFSVLEIYFSILSAVISDDNGMYIKKLNKIFISKVSKIDKKQYDKVVNTHYDYLKLTLLHAGTLINFKKKSIIDKSINNIANAFVLGYKKNRIFLAEDLRNIVMMVLESFYVNANIKFDVKTYNLDSQLKNKYDSVTLEMIKMGANFLNEKEDNIEYKMIFNTICLMMVSCSLVILKKVIDCHLLVNNNPNLMNT